MKLTPQIADDWRRHEEGTLYNGHIVRLEEGDGDFGPFLRLEIAGEVEDGTTLMASIPQSGKLTKRSKLGKWVALLFRDFDFAGTEDFDTDDLLGQPVVVSFEHDKTDDGGWKERGTIVARGKGKALEIEDPTAPF